MKKKQNRLRCWGLPHAVRLVALELSDEVRAIHGPSGLRFRVWGLGFGIWGLGSGVWGLGSGVWGLGSGVWGLGLEIGSFSRGHVSFELKWITICS